jgi:hypothetical protein
MRYPVTRVPVAGLALLLACAGCVGLLYQRTRARPAVAAQAVPAVSLDRVAEAVKTTTAVSSFRFTFRMTFVGPGETFALDGDGSYDVAHRLVGVTTSVEDAPAGSAASRPTDMVIDYSNGLVEYMRSGMFDGHLPAGKSWIRLDLGKYLKKEGVDLTRVMQSSSADPTQMLDVLRRTSEPQLVGTEQVGGESTSHYQATVDVARLIATSKDPVVRASLKRAAALAGKGSYPVDVWIDGQGYLRRMQTTDWQTLPDARRTPVVVTATEDLSDFGSGATVGVPSGPSVVGLEDVPGFGG